jgi:GTP-sensing pleiotropic transcriptional regulator CodY
MTNNTWTYKPDRKDREHEKIMILLGIKTAAQIENERLYDILQAEKCKQNYLEALFSQSAQSGSLNLQIQMNHPPKFFW